MTIRAAVNGLITRLGGQFTSFENYTDIISEGCTIESERAADVVRRELQPQIDELRAQITALSGLVSTLEQSSGG
jgi:hypothetical protein